MMSVDTEERENSIWHVICFTLYGAQELEFTETEKQIQNCLVLSNGRASLQATRELSD